MRLKQLRRLWHKAKAHQLSVSCSHAILLAVPSGRASLPRRAIASRPD
jgi:hypothetical protein